MGVSLEFMVDKFFQHHLPAVGMPSSVQQLALCQEHSNAEKQSDQEDANTTSPPDKPSNASFVSLPTEIHLEISSHLIYPDALSLKQVSRYFFSTVDTGTDLKIDWLVSRRKLHLECPNDKGCYLGGDVRFCRGSVALLMKRRREHIECDSRPGIGCIIYGTTTCSHRQKSQKRWKSGLQTKYTIELWWLILLALLPIAVARAWMLVSDHLYGCNDEQRH